MKYGIIIIAMFFAVAGCKKLPSWVAELNSPPAKSTFHSGDTIPITVRYKNPQAKYNDSLYISISLINHRADSLLEMKTFLVGDREEFFDYFVYYTNNNDTLYFSLRGHSLRPVQSLPPYSMVYISP